MKYFYGNNRLVFIFLFVFLFIVFYYLSCQKKGLVDPSQSIRENIVIISKIVSDKSELKIGGEIAHISAYIINGNREPAQNCLVFFECKQGEITPSDSTDIKGIATAEYFSGATPGYDTISVKIKSINGKIISDSIFVQLLYTSVLELSSEEAVILADGESTTKIDILLRDGAGNPVPDQTILLSSDYGSIDNQVTTDFRGKAEATYTAPSSNENITDNIYAILSEGAGKISTGGKVGQKSNIILFKDINNFKNNLKKFKSDVRKNKNHFSFLGKYAGEKADTISINLKGVNLSLKAIPDSIEADGKSVSSIVATLKTADDSLLTGKEVKFFASSGTLLSLSSITDENGEARTELQSTDQPGKSKVTAEFGKGITDEIIVNFTEMSGVQIKLNANPNSIRADGIETSTIRAVLKNSKNNPITGVQINFTTTIGNIAATGVTDDMGIAEVELISERRNGIAEVVATYRNVSDTTKVIFEGIDLSVRVSPKNVIADNITTSAVIVTVKDAANVPIENERVVITTDLGELKYGSGYTDAKGEFIDSIKSDVPGEAEIRVQSAGALSSTTVSFTGYQFTLESTSLIFTAGIESTTVVATIKDTIGMPLENVPISFSTSLGYFVSSDSITNYEGKAYAVLASSGAGVATVTGVAKIDGNVITKSIQISITSAPPHNLLFQAERSVVKINGGTTLLTATVTDVGGNPVSNTTVSFTIEKGPRGGEFLDPAIEVTDDHGVATTTFTSGNIGSSRINDVEVLARVQGTNINPAKVYLTIAGAPKSITVGFSTPPTDNGDGTYSLPVVAIVSDINGNPVIDGTLVFFTQSPVIGNIKSPIETADGKATTQLVYPANKASSFIEIIGTSKGISDTVSLNLPGMSGVVGSVKLQLPAGASKKILGNGEDKTTIGALVKDTGDNPVGDVIVNFKIINNTGTIESSAISGTQLTAEGTTNPNWGFAFVTVTSEACTTDKFPIIVATVSGFSDTFYSDSNKGIIFAGIDLNAYPEKDTVRLGEKTNINVILKETTSKVAISNAVIKFGATRGTIRNMEITDNTGRLAQPVEFEAGNVPGTAEINVSYGSTIEKKINVEIIKVEPYDVEFIDEVSSILADGVSKDTLTVRVKDRTGNLLSGEVVSFSIQDGAVESSQVLTDENGEASVIITSKASSEDITTVLVGTASGVSDTLSVEFRGITFTLEADPDSISANGESTSQIKASLYETTSRGLINQGTVYFKSDKGVLLSSSGEVSSGEAITTLRSSNEVGIATITGIYGDTLLASVEVKFMEIEPYDVEFIDEGSSILADGVSKDTLTVRVKDRTGNLLSGEVVSFSIQDGSVESSQVLTDENGEASVIITSKASLEDITTMLVATAGGISDTLSVEFRGITFTLEANPSSIVANERSTSQITAKLYETTNHRLINQGTVYFNTDKGVLLNSSSDVINGEASAVLKSSKETGTATVSALYGDTLSNKTMVEFTPSTPGFITLSSDTSSIIVKGAGGNEYAHISAFVADVNGDTIVNGTDVFFTTNLGVFSNGLNYQNKETVDGVATVVLKSDTVSGNVKIVAVSGSVTQEKYLLTILPGEVDTIEISNDSLATNIGGGIYTIQVSAIVKDMYGNPVIDGTVVNFSLDSTATGEGPYGVITTQTVTSGGIANATLSYGAQYAGKGTSIIASVNNKATKREIILPYAQ